MNKKAFNYKTLSTEGLLLDKIGPMYQGFAINKKYNWWYEVLPDDVVVDIGSCVGWFSAQALDAGAEKVYMIEPSRSLLKTACYNTADYIMDVKNPRVIPINYAIGRHQRDLVNVFKTATDDDETVKMMSFGEFVFKYDIDHIDFLKIDAEGAEFNILTEDNKEFFKNNVRHIAVDIHLGAFEESPQQFIQWRDTFLKEFLDLGLVSFCGDIFYQLIYDESWIRGNRNEPGISRCFTMYIKNY